MMIFHRFLYVYQRVAEPQRPLRNRAPVHAVVHPPPRLERVDLRPSPIPGAAVVTVVGDGDFRQHGKPPTKKYDPL